MLLDVWTQISVEFRQMLLDVSTQISAELAAPGMIASSFAWSGELCSASRPRAPIPAKKPTPASPPASQGY